MSRNSGKINRQSNPDYAEKQEQEAPKPKFDISSLTNLSFVVPTEEVEIPTAGKYYDSSSPLSGKKTIKIRHMTAKEEDLLSGNRTGAEASLFDDLIDSLLAEEGIQSSMLMEEDKVALLIKARETGYGKEYETAVFCENCNQTTKAKFDLSKVSIQEPEIETDYDPDSNLFTFRLEMMDANVKVKRLTAKDKQEIEKERKKKESLGLPFNKTVSHLKRCIASFEDTSDPQVLSKIIDLMPARDAKSILSFEGNCIPYVSTSQEVECSNCAHVAEREVPFSWALFRTDI